MKNVITLVFLVLFAVSSNANVTPATAWAEAFKNQPEVKALSPEMLQMGLDQFLNLTPKKYKELTGQKLGLKKSVELRAAQKFVKNSMNAGTDIDKGVYILLAIFGLAWLAMGLMDDWSGSDWVVNLILTILCWLPGLIHALVKMKKYYN